MLKIFLKRPGNGSKDRQSGGRGDDTEGSGSGDEPGKIYYKCVQKYLQHLCHIINQFTVEGRT